MREKNTAELSQDVLTKIVEARVVELKKVLVEKVAALKEAPEGYLRFVKKGSNIQYYHKHSSSTREGTYLKREQDSLAAELAQKDYDCKLIKELKAEIKALDRLITEYYPEKIDEIYNSLHKYRKKLIRPARLPDAEYVKQWMSIEYDRKGFEENVPEYHTANGERVRSKSEILIADALRRHKIPYRYEYPIYINGFGKIHPDFMCLNVQKRQEYVWEHNGMMSDKDYADYAIKKIEKYALAGYDQGKNLILSFETSSHPLNSRVIERYIEKNLFYK